VREKVSVIFRQLAGERTREVDGAVLSVRTRDTIAAALAQEYGDDTAAKLGSHMSDWNHDAALFLIHAPNHIREACRLTGSYVWEDFLYDDDA
jgi:hypothetical protein